MTELKFLTGDKFTFLLCLFFFPQQLYLDVPFYPFCFFSKRCATKYNGTSLGQHCSSSNLGLRNEIWNNGKQERV